MSDYKCVCAIDVGIRNFAYCIVDSEHVGMPLHWKHQDLWEPRPGRRRKPTREDIIRITSAWVGEHMRDLQWCDVIVLENQIRETFIIMNVVIQTLLLDKVRVVHPMTVGTFWKLPKTREQKKAAGIATVKERHVEFPSYWKEDDLADAWLMAVYQLVQEGGLSKSELF